MEPENPTFPTPPPQVTPPAVSPVFPKKNNLVVILLSILLVITLLIGSYLFLQVQSLTKQLAQLQIQPTPTPLSTEIPSPTPDPTANWKTYTNTQYKYSVKYPADYSVTETSPDYVRFSPGINDPNLPQGQTYLSIQLDKSPQNLPEAIYKMTADGKTLRISQILSDIEESQKPQIKAVFDQILSTFKFME